MNKPERDEQLSQLPTSSTYHHAIATFLQRQPYSARPLPEIILYARCEERDDDDDDDDSLEFDGINDTPVPPTDIPSLELGTPISAESASSVAPLTPIAHMETDEDTRVVATAKPNDQAATANAIANAIAIASSFH
jgi:hypothetical protein